MPMVAIVRRMNTTLMIWGRPGIISFSLSKDTKGQHAKTQRRKEGPFAPFFASTPVLSVVEGRLCALSSTFALPNTHAMITIAKEKKKLAPAKDTSNPYESMIRRFDVAAKMIGLDEETYNILKTPSRQYLASLPVVMDDGKVHVFEA